MTTTQIETTQRAAATPRKASNSRDRLAGPLGMAILYGFLSFLALLAAFPFYFMLVTSTHRTADILRIPPPLWFGSALVTNYQELVSALPFWNALFNSIAISTMHTVLVLFFCSLAGYGFAKYRFPGREGLFAFLLATLMVPGVIGLIPSFIIMRWLNSLMVNTLASFFVLSCSFVIRFPKNFTSEIHAKKD